MRHYDGLYPGFLALVKEINHYRLRLILRRESFGRENTERELELKEQLDDLSQNDENIEPLVTDGANKYLHVIRLSNRHPLRLICIEI